MSLFAQMGFEGVFFARIEYQDYAVRSTEKRLEWEWHPSKSLGKRSTIFTHALYGTAYGPPKGFNFNSGDEPVNDDPALENYNVERFADKMAEEVAKRAQCYRTNHIFMTFGSDFQYMNPRLNFKNMNKVPSLPCPPSCWCLPFCLYLPLPRLGIFFSVLFPSFFFLVLLASSSLLLSPFFFLLCSPIAILLSSNFWPLAPPLLFPS